MDNSKGLCNCETSARLVNFRLYLMFKNNFKFDLKKYKILTKNCKSYYLN